MRKKYRIDKIFRKQCIEKKNVSYNSNKVSINASNLFDHKCTKEFSKLTLK